MNLRYESATTDDIEIIFQLNKWLIDQYENISSIDYQKVLLWVHKKIETHITEYVRVLSDEKTAGYFFFHLTDGKMEIDDLYVLPKYRSQGIGTKIIQRCISKTNLPIFLYVFIKNQKAISLYIRLGFHIVKSIRDSRYIMEFQASSSKGSGSAAAEQMKIGKIL